VKVAAHREQRELSRSIEPTVKAHMDDGYTRGAAEAGTGSHRRRVALVESHVEAAAPKMFEASTGGVVAKLNALRASIGKQLEKEMLERCLAELRNQYGALWEDLSEAAIDARRALLPKVREALLEAANAVRRLDAVKEAEGEPAAAADGEEDAELVDTTDARLREKRARQSALTIDLEAENFSAQACPGVPHTSSGSGSSLVKSEQ